MISSSRSAVVALVLGSTMALAIILTTFSILIGSFSFEHFIFSRLHLEETSERAAVQVAIRSYLAGGVDLPTQLFTEREILHMRDVRSLMQREQALSAGLCIALGIIFCMSSRSWAVWVPILRGTVLWLAAVLLLIGLIGGLYFDQLFTSFHQLLFTNDYWQLDPAQSALIRAYPPEFFQAFARYSVYILIGICVVSYSALSCRWQRGKTMVS